MKKIYALSAAIILSLSLCACGNVTQPAASSEAVSEKAAESISESAAEAEESSEEETESSAEDTQSSETITESQADSKEETSESQAENETPDSDSDNNEQLGDFGIEKNDDGTVTMMLSDAFLVEDESISYYSGLDGFIKSEIIDTDEDGNPKHVYLTFTEEGYKTIADEGMQSCKYMIVFVPKSYETITDLKFNEEFTDFYIYTSNQKDFENSEDKSITGDIEYITTFYHAYALDDDDVTITYHFIDADGNEFLTDVLDDDERQSLKKVEGTERHYND